jgi:hypothetical protein
MEGTMSINKFYLGGISLATALVLLLAGHGLGFLIPTEVSITGLRVKPSTNWITNDRISSASKSKIIQTVE